MSTPLAGRGGALWSPSRAALLPLQSLEIDQSWSRSRPRAEVVRLHLSFKCRCARPPGLRAQREPLRGLQFSPFRASGNCRDGPAQRSLGKGAWAPWEYVPNLLSAPALVTSSSLWSLSGSLSTCQSCPLCLSLRISPSVSSTISRLSPSLTSLLFLSVYLPDSPSLSFSPLSFPRLPAFLCLGGLLSLHLSLCPSRSHSLLAPSGG